MDENSFQIDGDARKDLARDIDLLAIVGRVTDDRRLGCCSVFFWTCLAKASKFVCERSERGMASGRSRILPELEVEAKNKLEPVAFKKDHAQMSSFVRLYHAAIWLHSSLDRLLRGRNYESWLAC